MNHLQYETSPYLLQHAHNPVEWYAWKPEALEKARKENKPILVSIGYSTCHWCHVMERESFENPDIAAFMNEHFVNIKVDREERPDVDAIYMEACQILTGSGGWPLNCFLTPDGRPFYAGTYYPPRPAHNRPSWLQVLQHMSNAWEAQREAVYEQADKLMNYIRRNDDVLLSNPDLNPVPQESAPFGTTGPGGSLEAIFYQMRERFDRVEGGFGGAPKFPSTMAIQFLLSYHWFTGNEEALEQALLSLDKMIHGGIYDQLGGGFARYATDRAWLVPHFEKMLYDNALLVSVLSEAVKLLQSNTEIGQRHAGRLQTYRETIRETLAYIAREMTHPSGVFYSAQDADSEGVEGKFFVWEVSEIESVLGEGAPLFCDFYGVTEAGNWEHRNILSRAKGDFQEYAAAKGMDPDTLKVQLAEYRQQLFRIRAGRIPPGLDDKVLLGWNALMISGYTAAYTALGEEAYRQAAVNALDLLLKEFNQEGRLLHTWKDGRAQYAALLDDYAFLIAALTDVYQITFEKTYLETAGRYMEHVFQDFLDAESRMFYYTGANQSDVVVRKKDLYDNATPSGNSTMVHNLQRLGILLDRREWREHAAGMLARMLPTLEKYPLSFERWAAALLCESYAIHEIGVVGANAFEKALQINRRFLPNKVLAAATNADHSLPLLSGKTGAEDALIYVCRDYACRRPVSSLEEFEQWVRPR